MKSKKHASLPEEAMKAGRVSGELQSAQIEEEQEKILIARARALARQPEKLSERLVKT